MQFILELLASGAKPDEILAAYPQVSSEGLTAAFEYAATSMRDEFVWDGKISA